MIFRDGRGHTEWSELYFYLICCIYIAVPTNRKRSNRRMFNEINPPNCFLAATGRKNKFLLRSCDKMQVQRHVAFRGSTRGDIVPLFPSNIAQCSRIPTVFPNSLLPCLTLHLITIPHHQRQHLAIPMFPETSSFSGALTIYTENPEILVRK